MLGRGSSVEAQNWMRRGKVVVKEGGAKSQNALHEILELLKNLKLY